MFGFNNLLYLITLLILGLLISTIIVPFNKNKTKTNIVTLFAVSLLGRTALIFFNESLGILPPRKAGTIALRIFDHVTIDISNNLELLISTKFGFQTLLNIPGLFFFGAERINLLLTNTFLTSLAAIIIFSYLYYLYTLKTAYLGWLLVTIIPVANTYSIFGLRDPVIYFFSVLYVGSFLFIVKTTVTEKWGKYNLMILGLSLFAIFSLRPSLLPVALTIPFLYAIRYLYGNFKKIRNRANQGLILMFFIIFNIGFLLGPGMYIYNIALSGIGVGQTVAPWQLAGSYAQSRFHRAAGEQTGGGSHILPPAIYNNTNALTRIPIQTIGLIWLPLPWLLTSPTRILAFIDSLLIMYCLSVVYRYRKIPKRWPTSDRIVWWFIFTAFVVGILGLGLIVNNAGNAYRMRLAVAPYLLIPTAIMLGSLRNRKPRRKTRLP